MSRSTVARARVFGRAREAAELPGTPIVDLLALWRALYREPSYKLDAVARAHLGGLCKTPGVKYADIRRHSQTPEGRAMLVAYCDNDVDLCVRLAERKDAFMSALSLAVTSRVWLKDWSRNSYKCRALLQFACRRNHVAVPDLEEASADDLCGELQGACVLTPHTGGRQQNVAVLDYASLYPSVIRSFNMCLSTMRIEGCTRDVERLFPQLSRTAARRVFDFLGARAASELPPHDLARYHRVQPFTWFLKPTERRGILPGILTELTEARAREKRLLKSAGSDEQRRLHDSRQLSLKLASNRCATAPRACRRRAHTRVQPD